MGLLRGVAAVEGAIRVVILIIPHRICPSVSQVLCWSKMGCREAVGIEDPLDPSVQ